MKFNASNNTHTKPTIHTQQAADTSDSEDDRSNAGDSVGEDDDDEEEEAAVLGKFKASRSKAIRLNLKDVREDPGNLKLLLVETIYHAKAHLRTGMIKACGKIVEEWGVNVPQEFVPFNLNGNKLYNSYSKVMASVAKALKENGGTMNFGVTKTGASAEPEYFSVARKIIVEAIANEAKKQAASQQKQALSARMDANANSHITAAMQGTSSKRKFFDLREDLGIPNVTTGSTSSSTHAKKEKPVDPFTNLINLQTRALELKVKKAEKEAEAIDLTFEDDDLPSNKRQRHSIAPNSRLPRVDTSEFESTEQTYAERNESELELKPDVRTPTCLGAPLGRSSSSSTSASHTAQYSRFATQEDLLQVRDYLDTQLRAFAEVRDKQHAELMEILAGSVQSREAAVMVTPRERANTEPMDISHMQLMPPFSPPLAPTKTAKSNGGSKKKKESVKEDKEVEK